MARAARATTDARQGGERGSAGTRAARPPPDRHPTSGRVSRRRLAVRVYVAARKRTVAARRLQPSGSMMKAVTARPRDRSTDRGESGNGSRSSTARRTAAPGRRGRATIYEVARRAGVSIATVSRVQRGTTPVTAGTRLRVEVAIEALRYTPSQMARSLAEGRHGASGIVFPDLSGPYYAEVIIGYEEAAARADQSVLILATHGRDRSRQMVLDLASRVDGLVVMGRTVDDDAIAALEAQGLPVVLLARPPAGSFDSVRAENSAAAELLVGHLVDVDGHRALAFLGDPDTSPDVAERWVAVRDGARARGVRVTLVACPFRESEGHAAAAALLDAADRPDALVCANDEVALGAITAAQERDISIPEQIAVTGWDDIGTARFVSPALTTVRQPMRELGARAAEALLERLRGDRTSPRHEVLPTEVVIRASCGSHEREVSHR